MNSVRNGVPLFFLRTCVSIVFPFSSSGWSLIPGGCRGAWRGVREHSCSRTTMAFHRLGLASAEPLRNSGQIHLLLVGLLLQVLSVLAFSTLQSHYHPGWLSRAQTFAEISYLLMSQTTLDLGFYMPPSLCQFNEMLNVREDQVRLIHHVQSDSNLNLPPIVRTYLLFHVTLSVTDLFCNCCIVWCIPSRRCEMVYLTHPLLLTV